MRKGLLFILLLVLPVFSTMTAAQTPEEFAKAWEESHISDKPASNVRHGDLKEYLEKLKAAGIKVEEVGRSYTGREIYQAEWGEGPFKVFMWSQMHGDEPTATSALVDMLAFLESNRTKMDWVAKLHNRLKIRVVPMLNPDGAEVFQRRNMQWIDINRDARDLKTPEGQLLKSLVEQFTPDVGFNLHNQRELTTVGGSKRQATISLLAVNGRPDGSTYPGFERNKRICSLIVQALGKFIEGHIAKYDDSFNGLAFGDNISAWGSPVILIETGGLYGKDEAFLVQMNFVAYLTALQAMVDGTMETADPAVYEALPFNGSGGLFSMIIRNAEVIIRDKPDSNIKGDIAIVRERRREQFIPPAYVRSIGNLSTYKGLEEVDASNYFIVPKDGSLRPGSLASLLFYKRDRAVDWTSENLETDFPPDGVFMFGKWVKPLE